MPSFDDIARAFFDTLYELRLPIAAVSAIAALVVAAIAWKRGWFAAARRHPGRTGAVLAVALAVGAPLTWYLASPIFIRTALVESAPVIGVVSPIPTVTPQPSDPPSAAPSEAPPATPESTPFQPRTHATGEFRGSDDFHFGRGTATILETSPGRFHLRLEEFSVRNGPDLFVYLSPAADGYAKGALELGRLKATDGAFGYDLPAGADPADFASVIIWCKQFSHLFATASFEAA